MQQQRIRKAVAVIAITIAGLVGTSACGGDHVISAIPSVNPPNVTYRLGMMVYTMGTPCSGCLVEILTGPAAGLSATSEGGQAILELRIPAAVTVRASKDGYVPATTTVTVNNSSGITYRSLTLESERPGIDIGGERVLEVRADAACTQLPTELRQRTYSVSIERWSPGARFRVFPVAAVFKDFLMWIGVSPDDVFFVIQNWDNEQDGIIEQLPENSTLRMNLWTENVPIANVDSISTPIQGTISYCDTASRCSVVCDSKAHQLTLTRR